MARPANKAVAVVAPAIDPHDWDAPPEVEATVRVRCIVHSRPWTHLRGLAHGEEAEVPAYIAALMIEKGQVE